MKRCIKTAWVLLEAMGLEHVPVHTSWRLNERSYGDLVGKNKKETVALYGKEQVRQWRRSLNVRPPPMDRNHPNFPGHDTHKYASIGVDNIPLAESLEDTRKRSTQYWREELVPRMKEGKKIVVCGHENKYVFEL